MADIRRALLRTVAGWGASQVLAEGEGEGPGVERYDPPSENVAYALYDHLTGHLEVHFTHGSVAERHINDTVWEQFKNASSAGNFVRDRFNMLGYPYQ
jgi:hypothetical protein